MSANIINKKHIDALCAFIKDNDIRFRVGKKWLDKIDHIDKIGQALVDENYRSVNFRYDENETPYQYHFDQNISTPLTPIQIYKACECYNYQINKVPGYSDSFSEMVIEEIQSKAMEMMGYLEAKWEITA